MHMINAKFENKYIFFFKSESKIFPTAKDPSKYHVNLCL